MIEVRAFIQARMGSRRFPGKVLAPLAGRPVLARVVSALRDSLPAEALLVLTSREPADDPLAAYAGTLGLAVHRGPLDDVFRRFQEGLAAWPCRWFLRVCADSPLLDPELVPRFLACLERRELDLVTNLFPRTFPHGHSLELVWSDRFRELRRESLSAEEAEHPTLVYYRHPERFAILNLESADPGLAQRNLCVDVPEDLPRLERLLSGEGEGGP